MERFTANKWLTNNNYTNKETKETTGSSNTFLRLENKVIIITKIKTIRRRRRRNGVSQQCFPKIREGDLKLIRSGIKTISLSKFRLVYIVIRNETKTIFFQPTFESLNKKRNKKEIMSFPNFVLDDWIDIQKTVGIPRNIWLCKEPVRIMFRFLFNSKGNITFWFCLDFDFSYQTVKLYTYMTHYINASIFFQLFLMHVLFNFNFN